MTRVLIVFVLVLVALSGCIGDDAPKAAKEEAPVVAEEAVVTEQTGSVKGQVITVDLEPVVKQGAALVARGNATPLRTTQTDQQGRFTFNGVPPGEYRIQITSTCCVPAVRDIVVAAGNVAEANFQLERLINVVPYVEENVWEGFVACGFGTPAVTVALCSFLSGTPAEDPNQDYFHRTDLAEGLKSVVIGMTWDAVGGVSGEELMIIVEKSGGQGYRYGAPAGVSPLRLNIDDSVIDKGHAKFESITEEGMRLAMSVWVPWEVSVVYQQPFTVYWNEYYNVLAPEGADPIPDL